MRSFYLALSLAVAVAFGGTSIAAAGSECCASGKTAASACTAGEEAGMDKGGAAKETSAEGHALGQKVPGFTLKDTNGKDHSLADYEGKPVVIIFYNQSCPFVKEMSDRLSDFAKTYGEKGVAVLAIDAGENNKADAIATHAKDKPFPVLVNTDSKVARDFKATRTPEVFVLDKKHVVAYHGMFDNGEKGGAEGARKTPTKDAVDAILADKEVPVRETEAFGCTIKFSKAAAAEKKEDEKKS